VMPADFKMMDPRGNNFNHPVEATSTVK
jgi:hypothetical protein